MKNLQPYIDIREEMELIKEKQQEIALASGKITNEAGREVWRLQIVWEYLRNKLILDDETPRKNEYLKRKIPYQIRTTGRFRKDLNDNWKITQKLHDRIQQSEWDRKELIHRNMFFMGDLKDKHIKEVMSLFREVDKLVQKHKKGHQDLLGK